MKIDAETVSNDHNIPSEDVHTHEDAIIDTEIPLDVRTDREPVDAADSKENMPNSGSSEEFHDMPEVLSTELDDFVSEEWRRSPQISSRASSDITKQLDLMVTVFNRDIREGWEALEASQLFDTQNPHLVAKFFFNAYGIDPKALGEFFAKPKNELFLRKFVALNDFKDLSVADAIRHLFRNFKPRGESAIIERIMVAFSEAYTRDNPSAFSHEDTVFQLAFAVMILNTGMNNPEAMKRSPKMCKSLSTFQNVILKDLCPNEKLMTKETITEIYESVRLRPIQMVEDRYMTIFRDSVRSGWVEKLSSRTFAKYQRRILVLSGHKVTGFALYYFTSGTDREWRATIPLNEDILCGRIDLRSIRLHHQDNLLVNGGKRDLDGSVKKFGKKEFVFRCKSTSEAESWVNSIYVCIMKSLQKYHPLPRKSSVVLARPPTIED